jgi:hypothetical protein
MRHARRLMYEGGVSDEARGEIWRCLLSLHDYSHTYRQKSFRNQLLAEKYKDIRLKVRGLGVSHSLKGPRVFIKF